MKTFFWVVSVMNLISAIAWDIRGLFVVPDIRMAFYGISAWVLALGFAILAKLEERE